ncbi:unnamed protein product [Pylaiella littoralis]
MQAVVAKSSADRITPLDAAKQMDRLQRNPLGDIDMAMNHVCVVEAPTQSGKTAAEGFMVIKAAVCSGMASVVVTQNKTTELARMAEGFVRCSDIFADCCMAVGARRTPRLNVIYHTDSNSRVEEFVSCLERWKTGRTQDIPVYICLLNSNKMENLRQIVDDAQDGAGDDAPRGRGRGHPIHLLVDEGDMFSKSHDKSSSVEKVVHGTTEDTPESLLDAISAITYVSASVPAMLLDDGLLSGRDFTALRISPSVNYHGFREGLDVDTTCTYIERKEGTLKDYLQFVCDSSQRHAGMVYQSASSGIAARIKHARRTATDHKEVEGLVTMSWSSGKIDLFTSDRRWKSVLESTPSPLKKVETTVEGVTHYKSTRPGDVVGNYPGCVTFLLKRAKKLRLDGLMLKSILIGKEMVDRGVSICGLNHEHHLDSMYVDICEGHVESIVQVCGRICSVEAMTHKTLWASKAMHMAHKKKLLVNSYCIKRLCTEVSSVWEVLDDLESKVSVAHEGDVVEDHTGVFMMLDNNVCRPLVERRLKRQRSVLATAARKKKVTIADVEAGADGADGAAGAASAASAASASEAPEASEASASEASGASEASEAESTGEPGTDPE